MMESILRLFRKALNKQRSEGFVPLLSSGQHYLSNKSKRKLLRGQHQFELVTLLRYHVHKLRYSAPADPYQPVWIDPMEIDYTVSSIPITYGLGQIRDGNWDRSDNCERLDKHWICRGLRQRFIDNCEWENTVYYKHVEEHFKKGDRVSKWGYDTLDEFRNKRCQYVDKLFESIQSDGYRPNFNTGHNAPDSDYRSGSAEFQHSLEPLVAIGRNGNFYSRDGRHRVCLAKILGINTIPVQVIARHSEWQDTREIVYCADNLSGLDKEIQAYIRHPDLEEIIPDSSVQLS